MTKAIQLRLASLGMGFAVLVGLSACAAATSVPDDDAVPAGEQLSSDRLDEADDYDDLFDDEFGFGEVAEPNDPFERMNRALLGFNQGLSRHIFDPMIRGYRFVVPKPGRQAVRRVFLNFKAPATLVNDLLQLRFQDAAKTVGRFVLNSTIGYAGLFDVAIEAGWEHHESDFGQTLGRYGVGSGPYVMLPLLGPSTIRDGFGSIVDVFFQPLSYFLGFTPNLVIGASSGFSSLDAHDPALKALEESSVDFYAALRSAFLQDRAAHVMEYQE